MASKHKYTPTEAKYKGGAHEMFVTYDLPQMTRSGKKATLPKVKRVYIAGEVSDWKIGHFEKRTGRKVKGVKISYEQEREGFERKATRVRNGGHVEPATTSFTQIVEVPEEARHVQFFCTQPPEPYSHAMQSIR